MNNLKKHTMRGLEFISSPSITTIIKNNKKLATITRYSMGAILRAYDNKTFTSTHLLGKKRKEAVEQKIKNFKNYSEAEKEALELWGA